MIESKSIGEINGGYSILFKLALASYPIALSMMIAFSVWVVTQIHSMDLFRVESLSRSVNRDANQATHAEFDKRIAFLELMVQQTSSDAKGAREAAQYNRQLLDMLVKDRQLKTP